MSNDGYTYTGNIIIVANTVGQKSVSNFPGKYTRALPFVLGHFSHNMRGGNSWLGPPYGPWFDWSGLVVPRDRSIIGQYFEAFFCRRAKTSPPKNFRNTAIRNLKYSGNITRSGPGMSKFYNFSSGRVGQRPAIDIDSAKLVNPAVTWNTCGLFQTETAVKSSWIFK